MSDGTFLIVKRRIRIAAVLGMAMVLGLEARLFQLQILNYSGRPEVGNKRFIWKSARGLILDRNRRRLVANTEFETLVAHPEDIRKPEVVAQHLHNILGISETVIEKRLKSNRNEVAIKRRLPAETVRRLRSLQIPGVGEESRTKTRFRPHPRQEPLQVPGLALLHEPSRYYLKKELAGQVIGWVNIDNEGESGVEKAADEQLRGTTVTVQVRRYGDQRSILSSDYTRAVPFRGADAVLTIDETIQWICEQALFRVCRDHEAKGGMTVVMEPHTGEILALANYPPFDPGRVGELAARGEVSRTRNRCISSLFEPGSTMKPFIVAAGLDCGAITVDTVIDCENGKRFLPPRIRPKPIVDTHPVGVVPIEDVLVYSSNIGAGKIAERIIRSEDDTPNKKRLYDYLEAFGFTQKTGIDLPGEASPILRPGWRNWSLSDILVLAFGTGPVMVTPISLARAYCLFANGGFRVQPHIIRGFIGNRDGRFFPNAVDEPVRVLNSEVAEEVKQMLVQVVEKAHHSNARSNLYNVGGKTGTSKKVVQGKYSPDHRVLSFSGFAPAEDPRIVVTVMMDEPKGFQFGNEAAAPVFRQIVEETLAYLHVAPDANRFGENTQGRSSLTFADPRSEQSVLFTSSSRNRIEEENLVLTSTEDSQVFPQRTFTGTSPADPAENRSGGD